MKIKQKMKKRFKKGKEGNEKRRNRDTEQKGEKKYSTIRKEKDFKSYRRLTLNKGGAGGGRKRRWIDGRQKI